MGLPVTTCGTCLVLRMWFCGCGLRLRASATLQSPESFCATCWQRIPGRPNHRIDAVLPYRWRPATVLTPPENSAATSSRRQTDLPVSRWKGRAPTGFGPVATHPVAARLLPMRRILVIVLLALLPLQFSWAAVASYCGHETVAGAGHLGHHAHAHHADTGAKFNPVADEDAKGDQVSGAVHPDCVHCHGSCGVMPNLSSALPAVLSTAPPRATLDETGGAHAPARPERPQWLTLA